MDERFLFIGGSLDGQRILLSERGVSQHSAAIAVTTAHDEVQWGELSGMEARKADRGQGNEEVYIREEWWNAPEDRQARVIFMLRSIGRSNLMKVLLDGYRKAVNRGR